MTEFPLYLGLVHGPVLNKKGGLITTSVTNLDIHDIARSCRSFGVKKYFIITPIKAQHQLIGRILGHWEGEEAGEYNPDRQDALSVVELANTVEEAQQRIESWESKAPVVAVTGAKMQGVSGGSEELLAKIKLDNKPLFLLFGTGWGLPALLTENADFRLGPIYGRAHDGYNHLSVRSAVAIYLDRLRERPLDPTGQLS